MTFHGPFLFLKSHKQEVGLLGSLPRFDLGDRVNAIPTELLSHRRSNMILCTSARVLVVTDIMLRMSANDRQRYLPRPALPEASR